MNQPLPEDIEFLEHHGVKGQKWGVRKEDELVGKEKSSLDKTKPMSESESLKLKYGPDSMKDSPPTPVEERHGWGGLTPGQKKAAVAVGGLALLGGAAYLYSKSGGKSVKDYGIPYQWEATERSIGYFNDGLGIHWENGIDLPAGTVLQRLSTVKETDIRPKGFFAAFDKSDVESYQANLPHYWKQWGYKNEDGFLTHLTAKKDIKAPSGKESFEIFKSLFDDDTLRKNGEARIADLTGEAKATAIEGLARSRFSSFSVNWANGLDDDPNVIRFFKEVQSRGYNALIDFNDSGKLAKTPLRVLDGNDFEITNNEFVSKNILDAAKPYIRELVHFINDTWYKIDSFLAHYGLKGFGKRKEIDNLIFEVGRIKLSEIERRS